MATVIKYVFGGRLGNRMFELMLAHSLARRLGDCRITGEALPEWGIEGRRRSLPARHVKLGGHRVDIGRLRYLIDNGLIEGIETAALGCRMELLEPVEAVRGMFRAPGLPVTGYGSDVIVINIRAGEILGSRHKDYRPLPFAFFARLIEETGLRPVFLGQIAQDRYSEALRARFPRAEFVPSRGAMEDFETIRASRHICVAVSTFSWLAAWLSTADSIHLPLAGMLHPGQRRQVDLLPVADPRYRFHLLPVGEWNGTAAELDEAIGGTEAGRNLTASDALQIAYPEISL